MYQASAAAAAAVGSCSKYRVESKHSAPQLSLHVLHVSLLIKGAERFAFAAVHNKRNVSGGVCTLRNRGCHGSLEKKDNIGVNTGLDTRVTIDVKNVFMFFFKIEV